MWINFSKKKKWEKNRAVFHMSTDKMNNNFSIVITDIVIQILGIGKCEWTEQRRSYHTEEIYLKSEIKIAEPESGAKTLARSFTKYLTND